MSLRTVRDDQTSDPRPTIIVLGGHRTGQDAVDLFGDVGGRAVVGIDYPYDGPDKVRGLSNTIRTIPLARQAFLDTVPATSLVIDWLLDQPWVDPENLILIGGSLGHPLRRRLHSVTFT